MDLSNQSSSISNEESNNETSNTAHDNIIKKFFPKSFIYFKLGILFYILCKIKNIKSTDEQIKLFYKIEEFKKQKYIFYKIYEYIFLKKNALVYTFFMQLPNIFLLFPSELIYYRPYITFYKNNKKIDLNIENDFKILELMSDFMTYRIKIDEKNVYKKLFKTFQPQTEFPPITTIYIPIDDNFVELLNKFISEKKNILYLIYYDNSCYVAKNNGNNIMNLIYKKENNQYTKVNIDITLDISKLEYIIAMLPLSKADIYDCFDTDILPKDSLLYHNSKLEYTENIPNLKKIFLALYPDINLADPYVDIINRSYNCYTFKSITDIKLINLNKDSFYHQLFDKKDNEEEFIYKDTRDNSKVIKSKLFQCIGNDLDKRKQCNMTVKTAERSQGKRMLVLLIVKSSLFWPGDDFYYMNFLKHYNIDTFVYHIGFFKNKSYASELGITDNADKYIKFTNYHKDVCNKDSL